MWECVARVGGVVESDNARVLHRHVEPSYVIRLFLDAHRIHNLTTYLESLHNAEIATTDHTTLLLNCYTKLKVQDKLKAFIRGEQSSDSSTGSASAASGVTPSVGVGAGAGAGAGAGSSSAQPSIVKKKKLTFDVETAIRVLRQAGCLDEALYLAQHEGRHGWFLKIQVEDRHDYDAALAYIRQLPFLEAEANLKKYGKALVTHRPLQVRCCARVLVCAPVLPDVQLFASRVIPEQTTKLLMALCTNYVPEGSDPSPHDSGPRASPNAQVPLKCNAEVFIPLYVDHPKHLRVSVC